MAEKANLVDYIRMRDRYEKIMIQQMQWGKIKKKHVKKVVRTNKFMPC